MLNKEKRKEFSVVKTDLNLQNIASSFTSIPFFVQYREPCKNERAPISRKEELHVQLKMNAYMRKSN